MKTEESRSAEVLEERDKRMPGKDQRYRPDRKGAAKGEQEGMTRTTTAQGEANYPSPLPDSGHGEYAHAAENSQAEERDERRTKVLNRMASKAVRHRGPGTVARPMERSKRTIAWEMVQRDLGSVGERFASFADGGWESSLLLAAQNTRAALLARAQEEAAMEAQDILSQADEALVLG